MEKHIIYNILLIFLILLLFSIVVFGVSYYNSGPNLEANVSWYYNLTNVSQSSLSFGDIDNDGDLDLVLTGLSSIRIAKIYINNGTSLIENSTWYQNLTGVSDSSTAFGDIDNDGDLDLVLTGYTGSTGLTKIYINNGTSLIENSTWYQNISTTNIYEGTVAFGDIDNDGDLDLGIIGADSANENGIYINNGTSFVKSFTWLESLPKVGQGCAAATLNFGDVDNDTNLDMVYLGEYCGGFERGVYINNGTALVEDSIWEQNIHAYYGDTSLIFGDYDNDGDLDFITTGSGSEGDVTAFWNNNGTTFVRNTSSEASIVDVYEGSLSFGDYDNDGDLDLASTGNEGASYVYNNNNSAFDSLRFWIDIKNLKSGSTIIWNDLDNDTDLDIIEVGLDGSVNHALVYINNASLTTPNTQPTSPNYFSNRTESGIVYLGWGNGSDAETPSNGLYYNLRVGSTSGGNQIVSGIYGGGEDNGYFGNMMQRRNLSLTTTRLSPNTIYYWSVQVIDTGLQKSAWSSEQNFTTPGDITNPTITLNAPINYYNTTNYLITFNVTPTDNINVSNVTIYGNWTGTWHANITNSTAINGTNHIFNINLTANGNGNYIWASRVCDNSSNCILSGNRTFTIDTTYPKISLISPANDTTQSTSSDVTFSFNVTDLSISNCSLIISNSIDQTDYSIATDTEQSLTKSLSNGQYNWQVNCTDQVNYQNKSEIRVIHINYNPSTGGPSHGGVSISPLTQITSSPNSISLSEYESTSVLIGSSIHTLTILKLTESSVTLKINPELTLNQGETKIITLDNKNIAITLDKIKNSQAHLTFKLISEPTVPIPSKNKTISKSFLEEQSSSEDLKEINNFKQTLFSIFIFIIMLIIIYCIIKKDIKKIYRK